MPRPVPPLDHTLINDVPGWLTAREADLLYSLAAQSTGRGVILEIGSWKGRSTICLAMGSQAGAKATVYAVDPFTGSSEHGDVYTFPEFQKNIRGAGVEPFVMPIPKPSADAAKGWTQPIELLWIDGAHEEEFVYLDYDSWVPHLIEGGVIAFHDSTDPGPWKLIHERLFRGDLFRRVRFIHGITYAVRGKPSRWGNWVMMVICDAKFFLWRLKQRWKKSRR